MFDTAKFDAMPKYDEFKYWFIRTGLKSFNVIDLKTGESGIYQLHTIDDGFNEPVITCTDTSRIIGDDILQAFYAYTDRPEYLVGAIVPVIGQTVEQLIDTYETLLVGTAFIRAREAGKCPDSAYQKFSDVCLTWIASTDMYTAPASTKYHEAYFSGLLVHSLNVYNNIIQLLYGMNCFKNNVSIQSAALVALVHDWCKIDLYESYERNVKNDVTGKWEKELCFRYNQRGIPLGHGVASMFLASKCIKLSQIEALAIRWHMGWCRVADADMNELQTANENFPLVHLLQFADQLSICNYDITNY